MSVYGNPVILSGGGGGGSLIAKSIYTNGLYLAANDGADGYSAVTAIVDDSHYNFACNWDFANPINTRGQTTYNAGSAGGQIYTIDGWHIYGGIVQLVSGGLKLSRYSAGNNSYFMQRFQNYWTSALVDKTCTITAIVDGVLGYTTFTFPRSNSGSSGYRINNVPFRVWNYGSEAAITIDVLEGNENKVIQSCKLELGSNSTFATQINGVWLLNKTMIADEESLKIAARMVTNS